MELEAVQAAGLVLGIGSSGASADLVYYSGWVHRKLARIVAAGKGAVDFSNEVDEEEGFLAAEAEEEEDAERARQHYAEDTERREAFHGVFEADEFEYLAGEAERHAARQHDAGDDGAELLAAGMSAEGGGGGVGGGGHGGGGDGGGGEGAGGGEGSGGNGGGGDGGGGDGGGGGGDSGGGDGGGGDGGGDGGGEGDAGAVNPGVAATADAADARRVDVDLLDYFNCAGGDEEGGDAAVYETADGSKLAVSSAHHYGFRDKQLWPFSAQEFGRLFRVRKMTLGDKKWAEVNSSTILRLTSYTPQRH
jgi:hypothetical protein